MIIIVGLFGMINISVSFFVLVFVFGIVGIDVEMKVIYINLCIGEVIVWGILVESMVVELCLFVIENNIFLLFIGIVVLVLKVIVIEFNQKFIQVDLGNLKVDVWIVLFM